MGKTNTRNVVFYEKPGCVGNQQQKALLRKSNCTLEVRNLLAENWTSSELRSYFSDKPVSQWFNQSAPDVKSGKINIHDIDENKAINMMIDNPLLICRPLLKYGSFKQSGFVPGAVLAFLDISLSPEKDMQSCPMSDNSTICGDP